MEGYSGPSLCSGFQKIMPKRILDSPDSLKELVGQEIAVTGWFAVTQQRIQQFADATLDHQWIHVDVERAKDTPFGGTIAHGYYVLSLAPRFSYSMYTFEGFAFGLNYGLNRLRFPSPMPVGSKLRMRAKLASVDEVPGGAQVMTELTFEREGGEKPVCVAEQLVRVYTG